MSVQTHKALDPALCGRPTTLAPGRASVQMTCSEVMRADESGLVHGGFIFGLADHAAMLAVNEPTVVLGHADVKFLAPCVAGETLEASAEVVEVDGAKHRVDARVRSGTKTVFIGKFLCIVPPTHVLASGQSGGAR